MDCWKKLGLWRLCTAQYCTFMFSEHPYSSRFQGALIMNNISETQKLNMNMNLFDLRWSQLQVVSRKDVTDAKAYRAWLV